MIISQSRLMNGEDQLIVAHGSSLRALIKKLEQINDHDIVKLEVPNAEPDCLYYG